MADDNKATKSAGKNGAEQEGEEILPPVEAIEIPKENEMIVSQQTPSPTVPPTPTETVRAVALCPIYYRPGFPPHNPGDSLSVCVVTARHWLAAGLIRLEPGEKMPDIPSNGRSDFLVFSPSGTPAPASQG